jgi:hypothetical protein
MINILIRSNVDILSYVDQETLPPYTWLVAVQHNIRNIRHVPTRLHSDLIFHLVVQGRYSLQQFREFLDVSVYNSLVNRFGQHYRTGMIENNMVRFASIIQHVPVDPLADIIVRYMYN